MIRMAKEWHCDYVIMHFNQGCEGTSIGLPENRTALVNAGIPALVFESNMGDPREVDEVGVIRRIEIFLRSHGHEPLEE